jgi:hypothetical protein
MVHFFGSDELNRTFAGPMLPMPPAIGARSN